MHVTSLLGLIIPASNDEYTALVKSGNGACKESRVCIAGGDLDTVTY